MIIGHLFLLILQQLDEFYEEFFNQAPLAEYRESSEGSGNETLETNTSCGGEHRVAIEVLIETECGSGSDNGSEADEDCCTSNCGCSRKCLASIPDQEIQEHVFNLREMEKETREMYILGALNKVSGDQKRSRYGERKRTRYEYKYQGQHLCRKAFSVIYDVAERTLQRLIRHLNDHGNVPRVHGNKGRKAPHALTFQDTERAVQYIISYADDKGIPQPAAPHGRDGVPPVFLKASKTKKHVHAKYATACREVERRVISYKTFLKIWNQCCPHIQIAKPQSDVCSKCEILRKRVSDARTEDDNLMTSTHLQDHILAAKIERQVYKSCVENSLEEFKDVAPQRDPILPCTTDFQHAHYTFDYAQSVTLPHHARQMGPLYFLTPRKVHLFAVRDDGMRRQYNYVVDEGETIRQDGKGIHGPDGVISMLDHALGRYSHGEKKITLHSDNCSGQNKNRYVLAYMCWRTMTGLNQEIRYCMMIPGHARCLVDSGFGFVKMLYRRSDCETLGDIEKVVNLSSEVNHAVRYCVDGQNTWEWRGWKEFFEPFFKPVKGIRQYQQFRFSSAHPGVVFAKKSEDADEVHISCIRSDVIIPPRERPPTLPAAGLSFERQQYLARHVRQYLRDCNMNTTCPMPEE